MPAVVADLPHKAIRTFRCGHSLDDAAYERVRRELVLHGCKWDPQVGDVSTLARFPLLISSACWRELAGLAERLSAELLDSERELMSRPELHRRVGMPGRLRRLLKQMPACGADRTIAPVRTMRFDFHWTTVGWRISEVNSDVPGGFTESSTLPAVMAPHYPGTMPAGDPGAMWADGIVKSCGPVRHAALIAAPGYMEDQQILAFLRGLLASRGVTAHLASPTQIRSGRRIAMLETNWYRGPVGIIVRFHQAEWLASERVGRHLLNVMANCETPMTNPISSALTESKRFPLVWDELTTSLPTWRSLLMESCDPRAVRWWNEDDWVLKAAYCNTGDEVAIRRLTSPREWRRLRIRVLLTPGVWIAQRRFIAEAVESECGRIYPCIGVYTIDGCVAGAYGRIAHKPLIDFEAEDAAVLVEGEYDG